MKSLRGVVRVQFILDTIKSLSYYRIMRGSLCKKFALRATMVPLPLLALSIVSGSLATGLGLTYLRYFTVILLLGSGIGYVASLALTIVYGFISRRPPIMFLPAASLVLIALFVAALPEDVRAEPWRAIDIAIFTGLIVMNIAQMISLRKEPLSSAGTESD